MTRSTRRLIFYALIIVFVTVTPATILYASGYSFDWQKWQLIKTGSFYFKSLPTQAKIYVDGKLKDTTPNYISHQIAGDHNVQIAKDKYFSWKKNLTIEPQLTTQAKNILLIAQNPSSLLVAQNVTSTKSFLFPEQKLIEQEILITASSTLNEAAAWTVFQNNLYYLQKSNLILYQFNPETAVKQQLSLEPLPQTATPYQIKVSSENLAAFEPGKKLYLLNKSSKNFQFLANEAQGVDFSGDNQKLAYWTDQEIWTVFLDRALNQPGQKSDSQELLDRYSGKITQAVWFSQTNEHVIYVVTDSGDQGQIKITELDGRDQRNTYDIFSAQNPEIYFNNNNNLLYVLTQGKLFSFDLLKI